MNFAGQILLVDDEAHIRRYVTLILKQLGSPTIREAAHGADALALYQREPADVVLLDVNMPVMDGLTTLKELRARDPECVVIMLTSLANRQTIEEALALGAANYIRKDTPKDEIARALAETIDGCFSADAAAEPLS